MDESKGKAWRIGTFFVLLAAGGYMMLRESGAFDSDKKLPLRTFSNSAEPGLASGDNARAPLRQKRPPSAALAPQRLPTWKQIREQTALPSDPEELISEVRAWVDGADEDPTGFEHLKLARVLETCQKAPRTDSDLAKRIERASKADRFGQSGAEAAALKIAELEHQHQVCTGIADTVAQESAYDRLQKSARAGNAEAQVQLAAHTEPPGYSTWPLDEHERHKHEMAELLSEAQAACEPSAFEALGSGLGVAEVAVSSLAADLAPNVRRYANLRALGHFLEQRTSDAESSETLARNSHERQRLIWSEGMTPDDVQQGESYGRELFGRHCGG